MFCEEWSLVKYENPTTTITPLRCKCWTCELCRPMRKARLVREARAGEPDLFWTLTTHRLPGRCPHQAARALVSAWRTVRAEYIKKNGAGSLPFIAVFEETRSGWPHLHLVGRCRWLDQRWLSRRMKALIGAPVVDVRRANGVQRVVAYITKYIGKNPSRFVGTKRYWRSLDYLSPEAKAELRGPASATPAKVEKRAWLEVASGYSTKYYFLIYLIDRVVICPRARRMKHLAYV